jgi:hypothetical protein
MLANILLGTAVLMIGDSHLSKPDYLIGPLHDELTRQGALVHSLSACGAVADDWLHSVKAPCGAERVGKGAVTLLGRDASTRSVKSLVATEKIQLVIVVMGDTMAGYKSEFPRAWAWQQVTSLSHEIANTGAACIWIGPAWGSEGGQYGRTYARVKLMSDFLAANVAPCRYVDSLKLSKPGAWASNDGQHFTASGYLAWSQGIARAMAELPTMKTP